MTDEKQIEFMYNKLLDLSEKHQKRWVKEKRLF